jgi:hypothetical protein
MADFLIYQTSDPVFADRAIEALDAHDIPCFRVGRGARELNATIGRWTDDLISIYVRDQPDVARANEILISLGAVAEKPLRLPSGWVLALIISVLVVIILLVVPW